MWKVAIVNRQLWEYYVLKIKMFLADLSPYIKQKDFQCLLCKLHSIIFTLCKSHLFHWWREWTASVTYWNGGCFGITNCLSNLNEGVIVYQRNFYIFGYCHLANDRTRAALKILHYFWLQNCDSLLFGFRLTDNFGKWPPWQGGKNTCPWKRKRKTFQSTNTTPINLVKMALILNCNR